MHSNNTLKGCKDRSIWHVRMLRDGHMFNCLISTICAGKRPKAIASSPIDLQVASETDTSIS